jgi:CBS-domain-containing membrane protein
MSDVHISCLTCFVCHRVLGEYYVRPSTAEVREAVTNDFPKPTKRTGLKPKDVGSALLAHVAETIVGYGAH